MSSRPFKTPSNIVIRVRHHYKEYQLTLRHPAGNFNAGIDLPAASSLEESETNLEGSDKQLFLEFMAKMMRWLPDQRSTAAQLHEDPWLKSHVK